MAKDRLPKYYDRIEIATLNGQVLFEGRSQPALIIPSRAELKQYKIGGYPWWKSRELEGTASETLDMGVWALTYYRVEREFGDPGNLICPKSTTRRDWPRNADSLGENFRIHHYFRLNSAQECKIAALNGLEVRLGIRLTQSWDYPEDGAIDVTDNDVIVGSHAVPIAGFDTATNRFIFANSWGDEWGYHGLGTISPEYIDRYAIDAWVLRGRGLAPPDCTSTEPCIYRWKHTIRRDDQTIVRPDWTLYGREITIPSTSTRVAWSFMRPVEGVLFVDEFYVSPEYRRRGFGRKLLKECTDLSNLLGTELRFRISHSDIAKSGIPEDLLALTDISLSIADEPYLAFNGVLGRQNKTSIAIKEIPDRPSSMLERIANKPRLSTVYFCTNRTPLYPAEPARGFTSVRDSKCHYGSCNVVIPKYHKFGSIGSGAAKRWLMRLFQGQDDLLRIEAIHALEQERFWKVISELLNFRREINDIRSLVFIHGYNVSFEEAAIRAAQLDYDLKVPGITSFFSWPSHGNPLMYAADEATIEASEKHLHEYLLSFADTVGFENVCIIAHSMGNRGFIRSIQRIASRAEKNAEQKFQSVILAAPDVDSDLFRDLAVHLSEFSSRTTLYASPSDYAVRVSSELHWETRAGFVPPVTKVLGVDTVVIPKFDLFSLGHGYFSEAEAVLHDMYDFLWHAVPADRRQRLNRIESAGELPHWELYE